VLLRFIGRRKVGFKEKRKAFFSEEKKQKTFILRAWPGCMQAMAGE
jgi:hypothetical protein